MSEDEAVDYVLAVAGRVAAALPSDQSGGSPSARQRLPLTERECQVLSLLATGRTNQEIAQTLGVSPKTVMHHCGHIYRKLEVRGRAEAAAYAASAGLVTVAAPPNPPSTMR